MTRPLPGDPAPDVRLLDATSTPVPLSTFWAASPAVIVFLRYFGCPFCQAQVVMLRDDRERFVEAGATLVLIGQGSVEEAAAFAERKRLPFPCLVDPTRTAYRAYGLATARPGQVFGPAVAGPFLRANVHRETRQRGLHGGSFMQMPGTFVVDRGGLLRLCHRNLTVADSPSNVVLLEMVRGLAQRPMREPLPQA